MAIGDIGSIIDTEKWFATDPYLSSLSHATGTIYLPICSRNPTVSSLSIDGAGNIASVINTLDLGSVGGVAMPAVHIAGDVYAIAFLDATKVVVKTFTCDSSGNLAAAPPCDTIILDDKPSNAGFWAHLIPSHQANIYIVAFTDDFDDGRLATIRINDDGSIDEPVLDARVIEAGRGRYPWLINISSNLFAVIISSATANASRIRTFTVSDTGTITLKDTTLFDSATNSGNGGVILPVSGDIYVIFWQGFAGVAEIITVSIDAAGDISDTNIDEWKYGAPAGPRAMLVSENQAANGQVFVVGGEAASDQVFTVEILNNGTITKSKKSELTLVGYPVAPIGNGVVSPAFGIYAYCFRDYTGAILGGCLETFPVETKSPIVAPTVTTDPATEVT